MSDEAQQLMKRLLSAGTTRPQRLIERIRALGEAAIPPLCALLAEERLLAADAPGGGFAPLDAMELLAELGATQAIPRMLEILATTEPLAHAHGRASQTLVAFGAAALEPCLTAYAAATDPAVRRSIQTVLARLGVQDERILPIASSFRVSAIFPDTCENARYWGLCQLAMRRLYLSSPNGDIPVVPFLVVHEVTSSWTNNAGLREIQRLDMPADLAGAGVTGLGLVSR